MNPFEFVLGIILIVTIGSIVKARMGIRKDMWGNETVAAPDRTATLENQALRDEVRTLKERVAVLERLATDTEGSLRLDREIEALRDERSR